MKPVPVPTSSTVCVPLMAIASAIVSITRSS
jgi:hypothetical protein